MKNFPGRTWIALALVALLLVLNLCCYTTAVGISGVDPDDTIVVQTKDGYSYRLLKWSVNDEGDITGAGTTFGPVKATFEQVVNRSEDVLGNPFTGTIPSAQIAAVCQKTFDLEKTIGLIALVSAVSLGIAALIADAVVPDNLGL